MRGRAGGHRRELLLLLLELLEVQLLLLRGAQEGAGVPQHGVRRCYAATLLLLMPLLCVCVWLRAVLKFELKFR